MCFLVQVDLEREGFFPLQISEGYASVTFNAKAAKDAYSKAKTKRKHPTSVNLPEEVITGLKALALQLEVPYQALMRKFITEGLAKHKKGA